MARVVTSLVTAVDHGQATVGALAPKAERTDGGCSPWYAQCCNHGSIISADMDRIRDRSFLLRHRVVAASHDIATRVALPDCRSNILQQLIMQQVSTISHCQTVLEFGFH